MMRYRFGLPREQWRRNRLAINISAALIFGGFTAIMPFLPLYVKELGVQGEANIASWSGILITVAPLLAGLLGPAWGRMGDRYGMKIMVERCTFAMCLHWFFFAFAGTPYHLLVLRILLGVFGGFATLATPLLVATTPKEHMSRSIGALQTVQMVSSAAGPLFGGVLADTIGIRNTCLLSSGLSFVATLMISALYREMRVGESVGGAAQIAGRTSFRKAAALPSFGAMIAIMFFVNFVERSFSPVVALYILNLGTSLDNAAKVAGLIISLGLMSEGVSASVMGNRLRTVPARKLLLWRLTGGAVACFPMGLVSATSQLLVLRLILGLLAGGCMVVVYTLGSRIIPSETRGTSFSFLASAALLGSAAGPVVAGELTHVSIRAIFFFDSAAFLLLLIYSWKTVQKTSGTREVLREQLPLSAGK